MSGQSTDSVHEIVLLGAHHVGISCAHYLLRHVLPKLAALTRKQYHLTIVAPHTEFFWNPASVRHLVEDSQMQTAKLFLPIAPAFAQYNKDLFSFRIGKASQVDKEQRSVTITSNGVENIIKYQSLLVATGTTAKSKLWQINDSQESTKDEFLKYRQALARAKTAIITGGGPTGVESAGEIKTRYPNMDVTLYSGTDRILGRLSAKTGMKAQKRLEKLGVKVVHNLRTNIATENLDGTMLISFANEQDTTVDIFIDATGARANTDFLPKDWLNPKGQIIVHPQTCRVEGVTGVYAAGDCASNSDGTLLSASKAVAPMCLALAHDIAQSEAVKFPIAQKDAKTFRVGAVPIGKHGGVGEAFGIQLPSFLVKVAKSKDYLLSHAQGVVMGDGFKKP